MIHCIRRHLAEVKDKKVFILYVWKHLAEVGDGRVFIWYVGRLIVIDEGGWVVKKTPSWG